MCMCPSQAGQGKPVIVPVVLVHGGAGAVRTDKQKAVKDGVKLAAHIGYEILRSSGNVLDAVQEAVRSMELNANFNCGYGGVLTLDGKVEMDASIMCGKELACGAVSQAVDIQHPIMLARRVMEKTPHRYLAGAGAMEFAKQQGFEILPEGSLVTPDALEDLKTYKRGLETAGGQQNFGNLGTVGAVAIDENGNVAAATSTGGLTGKLPGRIGDSPIIGAGTYADNETGAVSVTGHGESAIRMCFASRLLNYIRYEQKTAQEATSTVIKEMENRFNQNAGVICVDAKGNIGIYFTTSQMAWAYQRGKELHYGLDKGECKLEIVGSARK